MKLKLDKTHEIVMVVENRTGILADISESLGARGVNIDTITAYGVGNNAVFRVITSDENTTLKVLERISGVQKVEMNDILVIEMTNRPGELGKITRKLSNRGVDLESVYIIGKNDDYTYVALKPIKEHLDLAISVLEGRA